MRPIFTAFSCLAVGAAALAAPPEELQKALAQLNSAKSYAWTTTTELVGVPFSPGPQKGVANAEGWARVTAEMNGQTAEVVLRGTNGMVKTADGWKTAAELPAPQFGGGAPPDFSTMLGRMLLSVRSPAAEAAGLAAKVQDLKANGSEWSGPLTPETAAEMATLRRGPRAGPPPKNARGEVRYWLSDGKLQKYSVQIESTVAGPDGSERDIKRILTTEFKDVGAAVVDVPPEVKKALSAP